MFNCYLFAMTSLQEQITIEQSCYKQFNQCMMPNWKVVKEIDCLKKFNCNRQYMQCVETKMSGKKPYDNNINYVVIKS